MENETPDPMEQFFRYGHLPQHLQDISAPFGELARRLVMTLPRNPERTVALRKLLEAKDCAVRALLVPRRRNKPDREERSDADHCHRGCTRGAHR